MQCCVPGGAGSRWIPVEKLDLRRSDTLRSEARAASEEAWSGAERSSLVTQRCNVSSNGLSGACCKSL